jgi:hypothetical protein
MYGLCGTPLINNCFVEQTEVRSRDEVVPRQCPDNSCPADIDGCSMLVMSSTVCTLDRLQGLDPVASTIARPIDVMARQEDLGL